MKKNRKISDCVFKEKAVELSYIRKNISEFARELGFPQHNYINGKKSMKNLDKEVFLITEI